MLIIFTVIILHVTFLSKEVWIGNYWGVKLSCSGDEVEPSLI